MQQEVSTFHASSALQVVAIKESLFSCLGQIMPTAATIALPILRKANNNKKKF